MNDSAFRSGAKTLLRPNRIWIRIPTKSPYPDQELWQKMFEKFTVDISNFRTKNCHISLFSHLKRTFRFMEKASTLQRAFQTWNFFIIFLFTGDPFGLPGSRFLIRIHRPNWIRMRNAGKKGFTPVTMASCTGVGSYRRCLGSMKYWRYW